MPFDHKLVVYFLDKFSRSPWEQFSINPGGVLCVRAAAAAIIVAPDKVQSIMVSGQQRQET